MSALGSVARRAAASIHGFLVESAPPIAATHRRERGSGSELKPAEPERTPEPPVILTTAIGASGGAAALAAAVGVASAGGAEGRCALLIDVEPPPRPPRPTVLASASARELEERHRELGGHFGAAAARGNLCYLPLSAGEDPLRAVAELVERSMHGFQHTFQAMERTDGSQDMGRIGPLGATGFAPAPCFAGRQEGIEESLAGLMGEQTAAKIVQQGEVEAWVSQFETQGVLPIHTAADGIGGLAVGEPLDALHHHHQR